MVSQVFLHLTLFSRQGLSCNQDLTTLSRLPSYKSLGPIQSLLASGGITDVSHHIWFAVWVLEV